MKFTELLEIQKELNAAIGSSPKNIEAIAWALMEECGEIARELRADWRWWAWKDGKVQECDRSHLLTELVDVFHFLLTLVEREGSKPLVVFLDDLWGRDESQIACDKTANKYLLDVQYFVSENYKSQAFISYRSAIKKFGFTLRDVEAAFLEKVGVNRDRAQGEVFADASDKGGRS